MAYLKDYASITDCGGMDCTGSTFSSGPRCQHLTGWYVTVEFLWIFKRRIFVCSDCGKNLPGDWMAATVPQPNVPNAPGKPTAANEQNKG